MAVSNAARKFHAYFATCAEHGEYQRNHLVDGVDCWLPDCPACTKEAKIKSFMGRSGLTKKQLGKTFDNYNLDSDNDAQKSVHETLSNYANDFQSARRVGRCLVLTGRSGTGKGHLSCAVVNTINHQGYTGLFVTMSDMVRRIRKSWDDKSLDEQQEINNFVIPDLLVLDDIGTSRASDDKRSLLFDVLNARLNRNKPTIAISNLTRIELEQYLTSRIFERLKEGGGICVVFDWGSHRSRA